ncbi:nickel pincer cofactor biosynthesis protein LarC [Archaeoglobales archaeon]|nr:MAG: nickel pincer cofactor biosynthesis protein LarC [Archaeoglobales archaeon]
MKVAIFDPFNGAGGNMIVASLLDVSLKKRDIDDIVVNLGLNIDFSIENVKVRGIKAKRLVVDEKKSRRKFEEVINIVEKTDLPEKIKRDVKSIFELIAKAEAEVHGVNFKESVFHEVGSDDAIFDVTCSAYGIRKLIDMGYSFFSNPIRVGSGFVEFSHGKYPVPTPATLNLIKKSDLEIIINGECELLTPTAAAILAYYCSGSPNFPISVEEVSYGAGTKVTEIPNVLRLILGKTVFRDSISALETNVDDVSGEFIGYMLEKLTSLPGVLDVFVQHGITKKSRPASLVRVLVESSRAEEIAEEMMKLTGSLGVRVIPIYHRIVASREVKERQIELFGRKFRIRYKVSKPFFAHIKPEFDDIIKISEELGISPIEVYREVIRVLSNADTNGK